MGLETPARVAHDLEPEKHNGDRKSEERSASGASVLVKQAECVLQTLARFAQLTAVRVADGKEVEATAGEGAPRQARGARYNEHARAVEGNEGDEGGDRAPEACVRGPLRATPALSREGLKEGSIWARTRGRARRQGGAVEGLPRQRAVERGALTRGGVSEKVHQARSVCSAREAPVASGKCRRGGEAGAHESVRLRSCVSLVRQRHGLLRGDTLSLARRGFPRPARPLAPPLVARQLVRERSVPSVRGVVEGEAIGVARDEGAALLAVLRPGCFPPARAPRGGLSGTPLLVAAVHGRPHREDEGDHGRDQRAGHRDQRDWACCSAPSKYRRVEAREAPARRPGGTRSARLRRAHV
mmetsp:Transcript_78/g.145  ORF Transcript_78/g.145 Transcript_78/m.145 type:complete len:356 (-) Transcript_78:1921-2988(-)